MPDSGYHMELIEATYRTCQHNLTLTHYQSCHNNNLSQVAHLSNVCSFPPRHQRGEIGQILKFCRGIYFSTEFLKNS